jgi:hypothetical protein
MLQDMYNKGLLVSWEGGGGGQPVQGPGPPMKSLTKISIPLLSTFRNTEKYVRSFHFIQGRAR